MICGVDEAGRGPLAGPVTAAAVILPRDFPIAELADSKALTPKERDRVRRLIVENSRWALGWASHAEIDRLNILQATMLAMRRAVLQLTEPVDQVLVDGNRVPDLPYPSRSIVKGDSIVPEIMAASILAKTSRDRWMTEYALRDDRFGFERHMGYPTPDHRRRVLTFGASPIHRVSFRVSDPGLGARGRSP